MTAAGAGARVATDDVFGRNPGRQLMGTTHARRDDALPDAGP
jgi:hypothetical protein